MARPAGNQRKKTLMADDSRIEMCPTTGCWLWMGRIDASGYGQAWAWGRWWKAHRAFFTAARGPVPGGLVLDHVCRMRCCVNPDHLRVVTHRENILAEGSLSPAKTNAAKVACPKCGREYSTDGNGRRRCLPCKSERERGSRTTEAYRAQRAERDRFRYNTDAGYRERTLARQRARRNGVASNNHQWRTEAVS